MPCVAALFDNSSYPQEERMLYIGVHIFVLMFLCLVANVYCGW